MTKIKDKRLLGGNIYLFGGFSGFFLLLIILLLFSGKDFWLHKIEHQIFYVLNGTLGISLAWDWLIIIAISRVWLQISIVLVFGLAILEGWRLRQKHLGRHFGFLIFAVAISLLADETADLINDRIKRPAPCYELNHLAGKVSSTSGTQSYFLKVHPPQVKTYKDLSDIYKTHLISPLDNDVLDEKTAGWFCLALMLFFGFPRTAIVTLGLLLLSIVANLATGYQWLMGEIGAFCLGSIGAGLSLVWLRRPLHWLERKTEEIFVILFSKSLMAKTAVFAHLNEEEVKTLNIWLRQNALRRLISRERFWDKLIRRKVFPLLNVHNTTFSLTSQPEVQTSLKTRPSPYVRFLKLPDGRMFVIKAVSRIGGVFHRSGRIARYKHSAWCNLFLEQLQVPVPRVYWVEEGISTFGLRSYFFMIEEFINGRPLNLSNEGEVKEAMRLLALLHNHPSQLWGAVFSHGLLPREDYLLRYIRPRILYYLNKIERTTGINFSEEERMHLWNLVKDETTKVIAKDSISFRLTHGDVTPRNFLVSNDGTLHLIDFTTVRYDLCGEEIIKSAISLTRGFQDRTHTVWESYFERAGSERWAEFKLQARLAFALFAIRELAHQRALWRKKNNYVPSSEKIWHWLQQLFCDEYLAIWGEKPAETNWSAIYAIIAGKEPFS
ncbi:MAG: aminoglycoside phosphotransferase family protein [Candidatus Sumerlaeia bacterium]|nr:aminoglycoside phosphotransferase family protein [Candidatus Sumerlaeia bacterium]